MAFHFMTMENSCIFSRKPIHFIILFSVQVVEKSLKKTGCFPCTSAIFSPVHITAWVYFLFIFCWNIIKIFHILFQTIFQTIIKNLSLINFYLVFWFYEISHIFFVCWQVNKWVNPSRISTRISRHLRHLQSREDFWCEGRGHCRYVIRPERGYVIRLHQLSQARSLQRSTRERAPPPPGIRARRNTLPLKPKPPQFEKFCRFWYFLNCIFNVLKLKVGI